MNVRPAACMRECILRVPADGGATSSHALYRISTVSVDVTDLLNVDFELLELIDHAVAHLAGLPVSTAMEEKASYAQWTLTAVLELQLDRVFALTQRLGECRAAPARDAELVTGGTTAHLCEVINRMGRRAQPSDYARLKPGGRDVFSSMNLERLVNLIPNAVWVETQVRLRAVSLLIPKYETQVARWLARGLNVYHAIEKVKWDPRCR
ncbi:hypothetical protein LXA47_22590 [Massilia sp. P8910]|uniref:hypothetical protein n=1 Tax=Massilia antarctica TaxID=2765360 RepID=UPI001E5ED752|nr:hypothetical protein [Massilia antarctica]MCE3606370.1 hypothetical protein [Massilia antarctica]